MRYLNYAVASLASALVAIYVALWIAHPTPLELSTVTLAPVAVIEQFDSFLLWAVYEPLGTNAMEMRYGRAQNIFAEADALPLQHETGMDAALVDLKQPKKLR